MDSTYVSLPNVIWPSNSSPTTVGQSFIANYSQTNLAKLTGFGISQSLVLTGGGAKIGKLSHRINGPNDALVMLW